MKSLILLTLLISANASAECFKVTDLTTHSQRILSRFFIHTGERRKIEYSIKIINEGVKITPLEQECILDISSPNNHSLEILCGENLHIEEVYVSDHEKKLEGLSSIVSSYKIHGNLVETWSIHKDISTGIVIVTVWADRAKPTSYFGKIESC